MIKTLRIQNYKSIVDLTLDLGRINVFIGENGCGKTNILEAVAMLAGAKSGRLSIEDLSNAGVRVAKPSLTFNAFLENGEKEKIHFDGIIQIKNELGTLKTTVSSTNEDDIFWYDLSDSQKIVDNQTLKQLKVLKALSKTSVDNNELDKTILELNDELKKIIDSNILLQKLKYKISPFVPFFGPYLIYNLNTQALRGQTTLSKKTPLGIYGENLDTTIAKFDEEEIALLKKYQYLISWLDKIVLDEKDVLKFQDLRLEGNSILDFTDKYMKENALFNIENANEGVLHILFYLTLFISKKSPKFFAIDNIETALNPYLCREIMKIICEIDNEKQALITTHNPAILDGLNLMDDNIRLFTVRRNKKGYTQVDRVQFRKGAEKKHKLSEMWMNGMLGAIPQNF